jgi:hypothetical protein
LDDVRLDIDDDRDDREYVFDFRFDSIDILEFLMDELCELVDDCRRCR